MLQLGNLLSRAGNFMRKSLGKAGTFVKALGDTTMKAGKVIGQVAPHVSALATIAGEATGNQTLKNIGSFTGKAGAIAQSVAPNAGQLLKMAGHSMQNYSIYGNASLTRDTFNTQVSS